MSEDHEFWLRIAERVGSQQAVWLQNALTGERVDAARKADTFQVRAVGAGVDIREEWAAGQLKARTLEFSRV